MVVLHGGEGPEVEVDAGEFDPCKLGQPRRTVEVAPARFQMDGEDARLADTDRGEKPDTAGRGESMVRMQGGTLSVEVVDARGAVYNSGLK